MSLAVISTHPIQYHSAVYRYLQTRLGIPVTVIYGSDFSTVGYYDKEFATSFLWDVDLLSGYQSVFLSRLKIKGARSIEEVSTRGLSEILNKLKPTIVLLLGYSPSFHRKAFFVVMKSGCPMLFRGETTDHARNRSFLKILLRDNFLRFVYSKCEKLLYVGKLSYRHFKRLGCEDDKLVFSPYCVDTAPFQCDEEARVRLRSITRDNLGVNETQIVLLYSGKLSHRKGVDLLLLAVKELCCAMRKNILVLFLGEGELRRKLEILQERSPCVDVRFLGFQNQTKISPYYHAADLLVLPSRYSETWGLVVNEALHHGVPCIVSQAVGCGPDLVEPGVTGEVFETNSFHSLALALQQAFKLVNNKEVREQCRLKVSAYTTEKAADGIAKAYWDVLREN